MDEKSEMQNGEQFATDSPIKEAPPAEYRKKDGTPFTAADLVTLNAGGYIECIEKRGDAEIETTIAGSFESLDNVPEELKKPGSQTIYFPGGDLEVALAKAKGQSIDVLRFVPEEDLRTYGRALQQYFLDNLDAVKLLEESAPKWVKETAIFLHQEQSGNPIFYGVSLMDFLQAAFDIENGWAVKEGPFTDYVEQEKKKWHSGTGGTGRNMILQSAITNTFTKANSRPSDQTEQTKINGKAITTAIHVSLGNTYELLTLDIETASESWHVSSPRDLRVTTLQLFDYMILLASNRNNRTVSFHEKDYMAFKKLRDEKSFREQLQSDIDVLSNTKINYTLNKGTKNERSGFLDIVSHGEYMPYKGIYSIGISPEIWDNLKEYSCPMYVPDQLFSINPNKNPHSYYFLRRIAEHKNMNIGKENEDIISIRSLLNAAMSLPTIEEVTKLDRNARTRIIKPFERDMDELGETIKWRYCTAHGSAPTCDTEKMDFSTFIDLNIKVEWLSYPDQTARLAKAEVKNNEPSREEAPPRRRGRPRKSEKK